MCLELIIVNLQRKIIQMYIHCILILPKTVNSIEAGKYNNFTDTLNNAPLFDIPLQTSIVCLDSIHLFSLPWRKVRKLNIDKHS
jgi:hypothetical protein